ncbi:MAG: DUF3037 domain-containing protein [Acidobacteriota bacterium]|nr:DUF3037 domain-containing protein [Acidobacteriota bacterium]
MTERLPCEFFLIRYVPDPVKGEFANIGVVLREAASGPGRAAEPLRTDDVRVRFTRDWSRVRCMDANADIALLEALEAELGLRVRDAGSASKPILELLRDSLSNSIQISEPRASLAENIATELDLLMSLYVEPLKGKESRRRTGRAAIAAAMRTEFERASVWPLMRKRIAASLYTHAGDPMRIDCGYRAAGASSSPPDAGGSGVIRMFHAVSLEGDVEAAKVLAYSAPRLREGVRRVESATLDLAAVVEPIRSIGENRDDPDAEPAGEAVDRYRFGVSAMEEQGIRVVTLADLARVAATAQIELRI